MRHSAHVVPLVGLVLLVGLGLLARRQLGIEVSLAGVQAWVQDLGWWGPIAYVAVVTFRQFLGLPAALVLLVGGLCFGGTLGAVLGTIGVVVSGFMKFGIARALGREWLRARLGPRFERAEARIARLGPLVVGVGTAYPVGPLSPFHWGAGLSPIPLTSFAMALVLGAPVRASAYSFLGASLLEARSPAVLASLALLVGVVALPLAIPRVRRRLLLADEAPPADPPSSR